MGNQCIKGHLVDPIHSFYIKEKDIMTIYTPKQASWLVRKIFDSRDWLIQKDSFADLNKNCINGKFGIKKMYVATMPQYPKCHWKRIAIDSKALPRQQFIMWLAMHRKLATVDRLRKWGLLIASDCMLCWKDIEKTMEYLVFECDFSRNIWAALLK